jgi:hypothetical protein
MSSVSNIFPHNPVSTHFSFNTAAACKKSCAAKSISNIHFIIYSGINVKISELVNQPRSGLSTVIFSRYFIGKLPCLDHLRHPIADQVLDQVQRGAVQEEGGAVLAHPQALPSHRLAAEARANGEAEEVDADAVPDRVPLHAVLHPDGLANHSHPARAINRVPTNPDSF